MLDSTNLSITAGNRLKAQRCRNSGCPQPSAYQYNHDVDSTSGAQENCSLFAVSSPITGNSKKAKSTAATAQ